MSITYEEALGTLNSMFGAPWTSSHLDTVLRHFQGHMENTVEAILSHGDRSPDELIARLKSIPQPGLQSGGGAGANVNQISIDEELARALANEDRQTAASQVSQAHTISSAIKGSNFIPGGQMPRDHSLPKTKTISSTHKLPSTPKKKGRGTPTNLPDDFLRIPGRKYSDVDADEALARMLQDDLFTEELANNPEFAHLARGKLPSLASRYNQQPKVSGATYPPHNSGPTVGGDIMKAIGDMGESAKRRLALFAANWNAKQGTGGNAQPAGSERRGLLDAEEGVELNTVNPQQNQNPSMSWAYKKDK